MTASCQTYLFGRWVKAVFQYCMPINVIIHGLKKITISVIKKVHVNARFTKPEWM